MKIDYPSASQLPQLRRIWQASFGDEDEFLDLFFGQIFSPDRCRCVLLEGQTAAGLYWFDCSYAGRPIAYLYAVATDPQFRGRGLCAALMADTHDFLSRLGYAGCILVPGDGPLFRMYGKMGYRSCCSIREMRCRADTEPVALRPIDPAEYARLRRGLLPPGGVVQEGKNLQFLQHLTKFYAGDGLLFCASMESGRLNVPELLGDPALAPGILAALGAEEGAFRFPGNGRSFAMYHPLADDTEPTYFGLAFD